SRDERGLGGVDVDTVVAGMVDRERRLRRVDLDDLMLVEAADIDRHVSAGDLELQKVGFLVGQAQLRVAPGPHERAGSYLQLDIALMGRVELVTRSQRDVDPCRGPVLRTGPPERDFAIDVAQTWRGAANRRGVKSRAV